MSLILLRFHAKDKEMGERKNQLNKVKRFREHILFEGDCFASFLRS